MDISYRDLAAYTEGRMDPSAMAAFERKLLNDPVLKQADGRLPTIVEAIEVILEEDIRDQMRHIDLSQSISDPGSREIKKTWGWLGFALAAYILVWVYFVAQKRTQGPLDKQELFALYFENYVPGRTRSSSGEAFLPNHLEKVDGAHRLMTEGQIKLARIQLENTSIDSIQALQDKAQWLLTLCHLFEENNDLLDSMLVRITRDTNHLYFPSAVELQADIR